jgi:uncharacterized LabA/DUF88 family protein
MTNDVAIFLDLDNLVIGAKQANLTFNINLVLDHIKEITNGRIVMRRSYGDWRQNKELLRELTTAGFLMQSTVRLTSFSKNLADMQIVVDTMDTLIDGHQYSVYVLMTGDRDFTPLVQSLRKRGKQVIGVGVRHTASRSFVALCDQYVFYESLLGPDRLNDDNIETLLRKSLDQLLADEPRGQASVLKQYLMELSNGGFESSGYAESGFRKFLANYPHIVSLELEGTTLYVRRASDKSAPSTTKTDSAPQSATKSPTNQQERPLHLRYRTGLKKRKLRVIEPKARFLILRDILRHLRGERPFEWRELLEALYEGYENTDLAIAISKNMINGTLLLARQAEVIRTLKGNSLSTAPVVLVLQSSQLFQDAVCHCDAVYLREILALPAPFDIEAAALALYDSPKYVNYLQHTVMKRVDEIS